MRVDPVHKQGRQTLDLLFALLEVLPLALSEFCSPLSKLAGVFDANQDTTDSTRTKGFVVLPTPENARVLNAASHYLIHR